MKRMGLIGGVTWQSTIDYYRLINAGVNERLGGHRSAELVLASVDFQPVLDVVTAGDWDGLGDLMLAEAGRLVSAGVDGLAMGSNTLAKVAPAVAERAGLPLVDMIDAVAAAVRDAGTARAAFLGTGFTMRDGFYVDGLRDRDVEAILPDDAEIDTVARIILDELAHGVVSDESRAAVVGIIEHMIRVDGVDGVILGCTELPLLVAADDTDTTLFDTTRIHADAIVDVMLLED